MIESRLFSMPLSATLLLFALGCGDNLAVELPVDAGPLCGTTPGELMACVEEDLLTADVETIAMERVPGDTHWQAVQDMCRDRLAAYGYQIELQSYGTGINVIGRREGTDPDAGEVIVSAHYDHIPGCAGADDNATGVAGALEIARVLADKVSAHPLVIACWDEEERGLIGSRNYANRAAQNGDSISAMFSLEMIGFFDDEPGSQGVVPGLDALFPVETAELEARGSPGDFVSLVADEASLPVTSRFAVHAETIGLRTMILTLPENLKLAVETGELRRSDHASFWFNDYPGIMVIDTGNYRNPNYHCLNFSDDSPATLDMAFLTQNTQATLGATVDALDAP